MQVGEGTRALITGASRGLGRALAEALAWRGAALGLVARSEPELRALADELPGEAHRIMIADVGDRDEIARAVEAFGRCDVLVANAGVADYGPFAAQPLENAERMTRVNWLGTVYTVHAALPPMLERGQGHVVIVSSGAGLRSFPEAAVYGATKAAQRAFGEALWHELDGTGVALTLVYPGELETHLHDHQRERLPEWRVDKYAMPARPLAEKVVEAVGKDERAVFYPGQVRWLRALHGCSPGLADRTVRLLRGRAAAPRRA